MPWFCKNLCRPSCLSLKVFSMIHSFTNLGVMISAAVKGSKRNTPVSGWATCCGFYTQNKLVFLRIGPMILSLAGTSMISLGQHGLRNVSNFLASKMQHESFHLWLRCNLWRRDSQCAPGPSWPTSQQCSHSRTAPVRKGQSGRGVQGAVPVVGLGKKQRTSPRGWNPTVTAVRDFIWDFTGDSRLGGFLKWYPQIIHFNRIFHYKPSINGVPRFIETSLLEWNDRNLRWLPGRSWLNHAPKSIRHREALESRSEGIVFLVQQNMTPNLYCGCQFEINRYTVHIIYITSIYCIYIQKLRLRELCEWGVDVITHTCYWPNSD